MKLSNANEINKRLIERAQDCLKRYCNYILEKNDLEKANIAKRALNGLYDNLDIYFEYSEELTRLRERIKKFENAMNYCFNFRYIKPHVKNWKP